MIRRIAFSTMMMFIGVCLIGFSSATAAEFEGKLDFFSDFDYPSLHEEVDGKLYNEGEPIASAPAPSPAELGGKKIIIDLEKNFGSSSEENPFRHEQPAQKVDAVAQVDIDPFSLNPMSDEIEEDPFEEDELDIPTLGDPAEGFNRAMYGFNDIVYENLMEPVASTYRDLVNEEFRIAIGNLFDNALAPVKLVSSLLQFKIEKSGRVIGRTLINTVFGFGGMLDVAGQEYGIKDVNEDFNQALGFYGIPSGPYIVLPFLGPSTVRGTVGRVVDSFLNPTFFASPGFAPSTGMTAADMINDTTFILDAKKDLDENAIDSYISVRDFYHQYTEQQIQK